VGGPMRGGDAGVRLLTTAEGGAGRPAPREYSADIPAPFSRKQGMWLLVARPRVFGSEELSALSPAVAERITCPTVAVNPEDAAALGAGDGTLIEVVLNNTRLTLPLETRPALPAGIAAITVTSPRLAALELPSWGTLARAGTPG